nr:hypothetical protein [Herpetosiphonaceae bacterium]
MAEPVQLRLTPVEMRGYDESLDDITMKWGQFWASFTRPARLISTVHSFSFDPLRAALQAQARRIAPWYREGDPRGWAWPWALNYAYMYDTIEELAPPLVVDHYALFWPQNTTQRETMPQIVRTAFRLPQVVEQPLPALIPGRYRERATCLEPEEPGYPWLAVLLGHDVQGRWTPQTWGSVLLGDIPLALCIDVQTIPRGRAMSQVTAAYNRLWAATQTANAVRDPESQAGFQAADQVLEHLGTQALHLLTYAVLVQAPTRKELERRVEKVRQTTASELQGATLHLDLIGGSQGEAAKL